MPDSASPPPHAAPPLRVTVDLNRCQAYAQCCYAAPEHFALHGREALFYHPAPSAASRLDIERARVSCPVQAIQVEDMQVEDMQVEAIETEEPARRER